ncbi:MAG: hypothetical protein NWF03_04770 [Candidatus Bathyarchaeota archaeon]|nr:hypothetical protein [Candidatus Bathyarchaeota archaeon]
MEKHPRSSQIMAQENQELEKPKRELPMWCRGIMGGCVNCGGCV